MAGKSKINKWNDIQLVIASGSMALTLVFWNFFAGPDRETALKRAQEQAAIPPPEPTEVAVAPIVQPTPTIITGPILLGGKAPQTQIIVQPGNNGGGGGGGGGCGGTGSS